MSSFELQPCPKVYIRDTHRSRMPEETLHFAEMTKNTIDLQDFCNISGVDRIGLPVYVCRRVRPDGSITYHTGKGLSDTQARVSLIMEAVERFCSEYRQEDRTRLVWGSFGELSKERPVLDPYELILPSFTEYTPEKPFFWIEGYDLFSREGILVPACSVYHPFHEDERLMMSTNTNGIASGNSMEEAVFHGLLEVIERDAWSIVKYSRLQRENIAVESTVENDFLLTVLSLYERAEVEITLFNYTSDLGIPVI
ncbi:MAG: YcaO-like family protein, partial [Syntrophales bacterium]|nr:YcaO-like family protein [Syntrophales bacterium]